MLYTIIFALLFLGETFSAAKAIGAILIFFSVILVSATKELRGINKGTFYALAAAFFWGTAFANDAYILRSVDTISYAVLAFLLPALPFLIIRPRLLLELKPMWQKGLFMKMLLLCAVYSIATLSDYYALSSGGNASQVSPTLETSIILTVILAAVFLDEKNNL